jgi:hypothetical protein
MCALLSLAACCLLPAACRLSGCRLDAAKGTAHLVSIQLVQSSQVIDGAPPTDMTFVVTTAVVGVRCCTLKELLRLQPSLATACVREKRRRERALDTVLVHEDLLVGAVFWDEWGEGGGWWWWVVIFGVPLV